MLLFDFFLFKHHPSKMTIMMKTFLRQSPRMLMLAVVVLLMAVGSGCKSKKKAMEAEAAAAKKAQIEQEAALKRQREVEEAARKQREEEEARARREAEAKKDEPYSKLQQYFSAIGSATNTASANASISEALSMFASPDTPVLIVIHESGGQKDYDRPTTIRDYLNYLKDQKKPADKISNLQMDSSGKINEVELIKQ
jgi:hypothetical protein